MTALETLYNDFKTLLRQLTYLKSEIDSKFATKTELNSLQNQGLSIIEMDLNEFVRWMKNNIDSGFDDYTVINDEYLERFGFTHGKSELMLWFIAEIYFNGNFENAKIGTLFVLPSRMAVDYDTGDYCDVFIVLNSPLIGGKFLSQIVKAKEDEY